MCGVAGFLLQSNDKSLLNFDEVLTNMSNSILHRGPDDFGIWCDELDGIGLAHRRLSILDLSKAGHQPMQSKNERYVISFNGEIYNHMEIRIKIENLNPTINWNGHSDTETVLAAFELFGIEESLSMFTGMFAISLWDRKNQTLSLIRDRVGEKPLYYGWQSTDLGEVFIYASELKAIKCFPKFKDNIDRGSLTLFLKHGYIPNPYSIYENIFSLEPGTILEVSLANKTPKIKKYWDASRVVKESSLKTFKKSPQEAVEELESLIRKTINGQMISDVPLGAFLSGGIDSSTIVSLMQSESSTPIKTFTIGFNEKGFDEAKFAKSIANHLGTDHTELYITAEDAMNVIPEMPSIFCEPFADPAQIPNYIVSKLASQDVKVVLSGDGGDELFSGYSRYDYVDRLWKKLSYLPFPIKKILSKSLRSLAGKSLYSSKANKNILEIKRKLFSASDIFGYQTLDELYIHVVTAISHSEEVVIGGYHKDTKLDRIRPDFGIANPIQSMMATDLINYLPDDILTKVDRTSMKSSLESRVPFLNHEIIEYAWTLPLSISIKEGVSKWPLHQILKKYVPEELTKRKKMGFSVPLHDWVRGPLKDWSENLLDANRLQREGYFNESIVTRKWNEHLIGNKNNIAFLWPILMFQAWLDQQ